ncbi:flavin-containing monooxygenase [Paenibacillus sp. NPDC056579]|uniref:flavin-containing monooxygenase n=1 Tax=Paenibacillus sp. NPDC056579 TaxID=3345871 RepID=UPI0036B2B20D
MRQNTEVLVIGAGQAGLAAGYYLKERHIDFLIIDKGEKLGHVWSRRYDSLVLFTPRWYSSLPGMKLDGEPDGYAGKDEVAQYLQRYAVRYALPVQLSTELLALVRTDTGFAARTTKGTITAQQVIVATGPFQSPRLPDFADRFSPRVKQIHTSAYANMSSLNEGSVLVVGGGNSGAQIAVELASEREVYLSVSHPMKFLPMEILGKSIFWWFKKLGILGFQRNSWAGRRLRAQKDPIFGKELMSLIEQGKVRIKPKTVKIHSDWITFADSTQLQVDNVLWATGFVSEYKWMEIEGAKDRSGQPLHDGGLSPIPGLYYIGQAWQNTRGSALLGGVGTDAKRIVETLLNARDSTRVILHDRTYGYG